MLFKIHLDQEAQTLSKDASSLDELKDTIAAQFKDTLPQDYHLEYKGKDEEKIVISSDRIFKDLVEGHKDKESDFEVYIVSPPNDSSKKKKERGPPIIIENASEFSEELKHGNDHILELLEKGEAPSDKSLPSSMEDYAEKVQVLNEAVKEIRKQGVVDLKPEFITDADSDLEPQPGKKVKPDSVVHAQVEGNGNGKENGKEIEETA